jgi:Zn-dependent metalloprotease
MDQQADKLGFTHYRFYQTLKGIPIENSMYVAHVKNGKLSKLSGEIVVDFDESNDYSPVPALSSVQAIDIAVKKVNAQLYMWQDAGMEQRIKDQMGNPQASYAPTATLVWFNDGDEISPRDLRLAFKVDVYAKQPLSRADYFIDAKNGNYLGKKDKLFYTDATGTAATAYSGSQTIHSDFTGTNYRLRDYTKGSGIITLHGESANRGADYTSSSANWTLTGTNIAALDAHYGVSQPMHFTQANFSRNSYNGTGGAL